MPGWLELVDAPGLEFGEGNFVQVRPLSPVPNNVDKSAIKRDT